MANNEGLKVWEFIYDYWVQFLFLFGLSSAGIKNHMDTRQVKTAVFDREGAIRFVTKEELRDQDRNRDRELQNIHSCIGEIKKELSTMPILIAEHLKKMGHLK